MVEVAKSVDNEVGDGTPSSVILAGALLSGMAKDLIIKNVHPSVIVDGYYATSLQALANYYGKFQLRWM